METGGSATGRITRKPTYRELSEAWWGINRCFETEHEDVRKHLTNRAFTELLVLVGWTLGEWNTEVSRRREEKERRG